MLITKEVVREGDYWYDDPKTGKPRLLKVTPELIRYWHDSGKEMLSAGLSIPVPLEHQFDLGPMTQAERKAKTLLHNGGWVEDFVLENGILNSKIDVTDPDAARKIAERSIRWTSPWFNTFTDPTNGKKREGVISHLALTSQPRMTKQAAFPSIAASLQNLDGSFSLASLPEKGFGLSRAALLRQTPKGWKPQYPLAFSLWSGAAFAADEEGPPEKKEKPKEKPEGKSEGGEKPDEKSGEGEIPEGAEGAEGDMLADADGDIELHEMVVDLLEAMGWTFEDAEITADNFQQAIYRAVMNQIRQQINPDSLAPETPTMPETSAAPGTQSTPKPPTVEQQPMYMSIEQVEKIEDPVVKGIAMSLLTTQQELATERKKTEGLQKNVLAVAQAKRAKRIEALSRTLTAAARDQLLKLAEGSAFSLNDAGEAVDPMDTWLSMMESQQKQLPALLTSHGASIEKQPTEFTGGQVTPERMEQVRKEYLDKHMPDPHKRAS